MATFKNKDQAEHLRTEAQKAESFDFGTSSLPSRKEVHGRKKQKIKWRIKYPLLKILTFFFVLLIIFTFAMYSYLTPKGDSAGENRETISVAEGESASSPDDVIIDIVEEEEDSKADKKEEEAAEVKEEENAESKEEETKEETKEETPQKPSASAPAAGKPAADGTAGQGSDDKAGEGSNKDSGQSGNADGYKVVEHVVKAQETIFRISMNYYNSQEGIELIKEWNGLTNNNVRVGQVLKIPLKK